MGIRGDSSLTRGPSNPSEQLIEQNLLRLDHIKQAEMQKQDTIYEKLVKTIDSKDNAGKSVLN